MRVHVDTTGLVEVAYIDGRHTAEKQWQTIEDTVMKLTRNRSTPVTVRGAWLITDDPNRRPYYRPGERVRG